MGNRISMAEYGKLAAQVLNLPRKTRNMLETALFEKRSAEDMAKYDDEHGLGVWQEQAKKATEDKTNTQ
ncbi:MAG: hypothetical protein ABFD60_07975 [Bryobacteraceae bacterium]